jgi:hypothetical protein
VATFEGFYRASAARDMATLRQSLCPAERRVLADVDDATLLANVAVVKVLRSVRLESQSQAAAVVVATDAVGAETRIQLRADLHSGTGYCVAGPVSDSVAAVAP